MAEYIEKEAALQWLWDMQIRHQRKADAFGAARIHFKHLPAADVRQNVRGEWETIDDPEFDLKDFSCSLCQELICDVETSVLWPGVNCYYFCPNCGADMRGGEDGK